MSDNTNPEPAVYAVAKQALKIRGVNAFSAGDDVPVSVVERHGWQDLVVQAETKSGKPTAAAVKVRAEAAKPAETPATA